MIDTRIQRRKRRRRRRKAISNHNNKQMSVVLGARTYPQYPETTTAPRQPQYGGQPQQQPQHYQQGMPSGGYNPPQAPHSLNQGFNSMDRSQHHSLRLLKSILRRFRDRHTTRAERTILILEIHQRARPMQSTRCDLKLYGKRCR